MADRRLQQHRVAIGHVIFFCAEDHDHVMCLEQATRLQHETCCWCHSPYTKVSTHAVLSYDKPRVREFLRPELFQMEKPASREVLAARALSQRPGLPIAKTWAVKHA